MGSALPYLLGLAMVATLVVLVVGILSFAVHGKFYLKHANNLMRARVIFQGAALAFLAAILWIATS